MSEWHGQISKIAIALQHKTQKAGFPNWGVDFSNSRKGVGYAWGSEFVTNNWLSAASGGRYITSREFAHCMSRYPYRESQVWRYACQQNINGQDTECGIRILLSGLNRASDKGIDRGAVSGRVVVESCSVVFTDGSSDSPLAGTVVFKDINGWADQHKLWSWQTVLSYGKPIQRVTLSLRVEFGKESYHDVGHRSDGYGYNQSGIVCYAPYAVGNDYGIPDANTVAFVDREVVYDYSGTTPIVGTPISNTPQSGVCVQIS